MTAPQTPEPTPAVEHHHVTIDYGRDGWPTLRLTCSAPGDALCHASHDCYCEEWQDERNHDGKPVHTAYRDDEAGEEIEVEHVGTFKADCNLTDWFDNSDEMMRGAVTVPVRVEWNDGYEFVLLGGDQ